ncbi:MAG: hypothetical protein HeimC3_47780 [Candidatus Heimdallarchaeota archaeon LC_3]|nr:MAG: hypothetical protein HeimC3_47780 [Candidatus Heimdallarchaeota archaeon LC_3]
MSCRIPPKKETDRKHKVVSGQVLVTSLILGFLMISVFMNNTPIVEDEITENNLNTYITVQDHLFINIYGEPEIFQIKNVGSSNQKILASSSNGLYEIDFRDKDVNLLENFDIQTNQVNSFDIDETNSIYFLAGDEGIVFYYRENQSILLITAENSILKSNNIVDLKFIPETNELLFIHGSSASGLGVLNISSLEINYIAHGQKLSVNSLFFQKIIYDPDFGTYLLNNNTEDQIIIYQKEKQLLKRAFFRFSNLPKEKVIHVSYLSEKMPILLITESKDFIFWDIREKILTRYNPPKNIKNLGSIQAAHFLDYETFVITFSQEMFFSNDPETNKSLIKQKLGGIKLFNWKLKTFTDVADESLSNANIYSITRVESEFVIGTDTGLYLYSVSEDSISPYFIGDDYRLTKPKAMAYSSTTNLLYIAGISGIYTYDPAKEKMSHIKIKLNFEKSLEITALTASSGKLFIGTSENQLFIFDERTGMITQRTYVFGSDDQYIKAMTHSDSSKEIYFVTSENIVVSYNPSSETFYSLNINNTGTRNITSLTISPDQKHLVFTTSLEVYTWSLETKEVESVIKLTDNEEAITSVITDKKNNLYFGTNHQLMQYDLSENRLVQKYSSQNGLANNNIQALEYTDDFLFVVTSSGLSVMKITYVQTTLFSNNEGVGP